MDTIEEERLEEPKAAEAILTDQLARGVVKYIDEHVFIRVTGEKARENFYEIFLIFELSGEKALPDVEPMRPFAAIEPYP